MAEPRPSATDDEILELARHRFKCGSEHYAERQRERELDDRHFVVGDQWDEAVLNQRVGERRPALVMNRTQASVRTVENSAQQNMPQITVVPVDSVADPDAADVIKGYFKHIEWQSDAESVYGTAVKNTAISGRGYICVTTKMDPFTLDEDIWLRRIRNPLSVVFDPNIQELDGADAEYAFILTNVTREEFRQLYPGHDMQLGMSWERRGDGWISSQEVRIAEYYFCEQTTETRVKLQDGTVIPKADWDGFIPLMRDRNGAVVEADVNVPTVWAAKINGYQILEMVQWPGTMIPVVPVLGDEIDVDGDVHYSGVVRHAKDPQRSYNYNRSAATELIALAPKAPYIGAEGQFTDHEWEWDNANIMPFARLTYKPVTKDGALLPPPMRQNFEPPVQALVQQSMIDAEDIKATTGQYDAALGQVSNETSGVAIAQRTQQSETSSVHFPRNLARAVKQVAKICLEVMPYVLETRTAIRIIGEDEAEKVVPLMQDMQQARSVDAQGNPVYNLTIGRYDVRAVAGPSSTTKRQEALDSMVQLVQARPETFQVIGDMLVKNMDTPQAAEMAERIRRTIPPEILGTDQDVPEEALRVQLRQALEIIQSLDALTQEQEQNNQVLMGQLAQAQQALNDRTRELDRRDAELQLKARIETGKLEDQRRQTAIKEDAQELDEDEFALEVAKESENGAQ